MKWFVLSFLTLCLLFSFITIATATELTVLIGDKDCYNQSPPECIGYGVANINGMPYAIQPFINRTDSVMNDNFTMNYNFNFALPSGAAIDSAFITINALDVESMGDGDTTGVIPLIDGLPISGQALHSVPKPWGGGASDQTSTQTIFNLASQLSVLSDGYAQLHFPTGGHGDNVEFDFVELKIFYTAPIPTLSQLGLLIFLFALIIIALSIIIKRRTPNRAA